MKINFLTYVFILSSLITLGQDIEFSASVNKNPVGAGERFKVVFTLNASGSDFSPPSFSGFKIIGGPNQSTSMQWINGNMSSSISFSYFLVAPKAGEFSIESASITANGDTYHTQPIQIKVEKPSAAQQRKQQQQKQQQKQQQQATSRKIADNLFMKLYVNKSKAYVGEEVIATYKVYTRINILDNEVSALPSFNGFWSQDVELPRKTTKMEVVNGVQYNVATLKKTVLFPQRSGKLTVDPLALDVIVRVQEKRRSNSLFDQFFGNYKEFKYNLKSNSTTIEVLPLPQAGKPVSFKGAVGDFSIDTKIDKHTVKANDGVNFHVTVKGSGNLMLLENPDVEFPPEFEVYDPKVNDKVATTGSGVRGSREYEYLLIPRHPGKHSITPFEFTYFDPNKKQYIALETKPHEIEVTPGEGGAATAFSPSRKEEVQLFGKDIRYIKTGNLQLKEKGELFFGSRLYYGLFSLPFLLFFALLAIRKKYLDYTSNTVMLKSRKANKIARKHLSVAKKLMQQDNKVEFYEEVFRALYGYASDKLNIPVADLTKEKIAKDLALNAVSEENIKQMMDTMEQCEMARFSPSGETDQQSIYEKAITVISKTEEEFRSV